MYKKRHGHQILIHSLLKCHVIGQEFYLGYYVVKCTVGEKMLIRINSSEIIGLCTADRKIIHIITRYFWSQRNDIG